MGFICGGVDLLEWSEMSNWDYSVRVNLGDHFTCNGTLIWLGLED